MKKNDILLEFMAHCFKIKNKGIIITETIIKRLVKVRELMDNKQVKEIQIFKKNVKFANKGDGIGMLIKN